MSRWTWWVPGILGLSILAAPTASAHGGLGVETLAALAIHPTDPTQRVLRYESVGGGLVYSGDGGASWQMLCGEAAHRGGLRQEAMAITADGTVFLGVFDGLLRDGDGGCGFQRVPDFEGRYVTALALDPHDPQRLYAATGNVEQGARNVIARREGDGSWSELFAGELAIADLEVVAIGASVRFYALAYAAVNGGDGTLQSACSVRVSDDRGQSWQAHDCPDAAGLLRIEGVDPTDPDRLLLSEDVEEGQDTVLLSRDAGASFEPYLTLTEVEGVSFAPDGRLWIGDMGSPGEPEAPRGLWAAGSVDQTPALLADYPVRCVHFQASEGLLHVCQFWWLGTADPETGEFTRSFDLTEVGSLVQCGGEAASDVPALCAEQLGRGFCGSSGFGEAPACAALGLDAHAQAPPSDAVGQREDGLGFGEAADGSLAEGVAGSGAGDVAGGEGAAGCAVGSTDHAGGWTVPLGLVSLLLVGRRFASRRRGPRSRSCRSGIR